jgi:hypothetical protein
MEEWLKIIDEEKQGRLIARLLLHRHVKREIPHLPGVQIWFEGSVNGCRSSLQSCYRTMNRSTLVTMRILFPLPKQLR